jgi:hypothetical protein
MRGVKRMKKRSILPVVSKEEGREGQGKEGRKELIGSHRRGAVAETVECAWRSVCDTSNLATYVSTLGTDAAVAMQCDSLNEELV